LANLSSKSAGNLSLQYLVIASLGILAIISGLLNQDIFLYTAVSGPLILFGIGIFLLSFTIEAKHGTSKIIDSYIIERIDTVNSSTKEIRAQLTFLIFILSAFLFLIAIYFLSIRNYSFFALLLSCSCTLLALTVGRIFGTIIGESDSQYAQLKLLPKHLDSEYVQLRKWLKTDTGSSLSNFQEKRIEEQKLLFLQATKLILSDRDKAKSYFEELEKAIESGVEIDKYIFNQKGLKAVHTDWLVGAIASNKSDVEVIDSLTALLILPSIIELSEYICSGGRKSTKLFNNLLSMTGICVSRLDCYDLIGGEYSISLISSMKSNPIHSDLQGFIKFIGLYASKYNEFIQFSPWWLLNIRSRLQVEFASNTWEDSRDYIQNQVYISEVENDFEEWCYLLSEMDTISNKYSIDSNSSFSNLLSKIDSTGTELTLTKVLQITWLAHLKLR